MNYLVFDMDGTIADLYGVENWLEYLRAENPLPYIMANPYYDMEILNNKLNTLKEKYDYRVIVTSWLSKGASTEFKKLIRMAKKDWLDRHNFPYDELHFVQYGTDKSICTRKHGGLQILVDDSESVRNKWKNGYCIDANKNIINEINKLFTNDLQFIN